MKKNSIKKKHSASFNGSSSQKNIFQAIKLAIKEDDDIRRLIREIANEGKDNRTAENSNFISLEDHNAKLKQLQDEYDKVLSELTKLKLDKTNLGNEITVLNKKLKDEYVPIAMMEDKEKKLNKTIGEISGEKEELTNKLSESKNKVKDLQKEVNKYKPYDIIVECFDNYRLLSESIKKELEGIVYAPSAEVMLACVGRQGFIRRFSDYITKRIIKQKSVDSDTELLIKMFDTMFDISNKCEEQDVYIRDDVNIGDCFSTDKHSTINLQQGEISDVLFVGYHSAEDSDKTICKSIVEVQG